ncbi:MAG TPA: sugar transferase [Terracidiphilus sp.]|nr:sugar transferase [Terracidiphilus sp.]
MTHTRQSISLNILKFLDLGIAVESAGIATLLVVHAQGQVPLLAFLSMRVKVSNFIILAFTLLVYHVIFCMCGIYQSRRLSRKREEMADIAKAAALAFAALVVIASVFTIRMFTVSFLFLFWAVNTVSLCAFRLSLRTALERIRAQGKNLRHVVVFGTNPRAVSFARRITERPELGYRLVGFVDDEWPGMSEFRKSGFDVVAGSTGLAEFLRRNVVDELVIYLPFASFYRYWTHVAPLCAHNGIAMRLNSDIFGLRNARWLAEDYGGGHYIVTYTGAGEGWPLAMKRTLDVAISLLLLLCLSPLLVAVAIVISLTSKGPVLFLQERIGVNKRRFKIYKFRTMVPNAEKMMHALEEKNEASGPVFKIKEDPRITPLGRFLRRSSIDELPQLLNVLKGDMSLVGPRPLPVRDYEGFSEDWQRRRFSVKPGITCLWQVYGRSNVSFDQWMLLDLKYMDEWSLWLDLKILAKTIPAVLKGAGAA